MSGLEPDVVSYKNHWLSEQVNVEFPTPESLQGKDLYLQAAKKCSYQPRSVGSGTQGGVVDVIYPVDFHRLTIIYARLQSLRWQAPGQQALVTEFLTQIILADNPRFYVGYVGDKPVAAAMLTEHRDQLLISDIVCLVDVNNAKELFLNQLYDLVITSCANDVVVIIEKA